ncbi:sulfatase [Alistipes sp.]|uniref:sulfatase family protein n=1 Tax=Alistipes sp. TaxID=1872444 RepID=UPI003A84B5C7
MKSELFSSPVLEIAFAGAALAGGTLTAQAAAPDKRPNIVWIMAEDISHDLGCYGMPAVKTPVLDKMASEGMLYTNARCSAPISSPSRSGMLTGVHCTTIDAHNHRSNRDKALPQGVYPFTYYLRQAGYTCILGATGAFANTYTNSPHECSRKIDCNFRFDEIGPYDGVTQFGLFDKYDEMLPSDAPFFSQITLYVTHRGDWWKRIRSESKHPVDPAAVQLPAYMADHPRIREEFACYLDQVEYMDAEVGMILDRLEQRGLADNTVVFFIGDNGRADIRAKGFLYDHGTRVPMIVWGKGVEPAVVNDLVSTMDITATILRMAGAEIPDNYESRPLFDAEGAPADHREWVYTTRDTWDEVMECIRAVVDDRYIYIRNYFPQYPYDHDQIYTDFYRPALHVMRRLKAEGKLSPVESLFLAESKPVEELYDYRADPDNVNNLAGDPACLDVLNRMRVRMDSRLSSFVDCGIADRFTRVLPESRKEENRPRSFVREHHPDEWQKLVDGEICDKYDIWKTEQQAYLRSAGR